MDIFYKLCFGPPNFLGKNFGPPVKKVGHPCLSEIPSLEAGTQPPSYLYLDNRLCIWCITSIHPISLMVFFDLMVFFLFGPLHLVFCFSSLWIFKRAFQGRVTILSCIQSVALTVKNSPSCLGFYSAVTSA